MFDHLVKENNLWPVMEEFELSPTDLNFIKEQIAGPLDPASSQTTNQDKSRREKKEFLYEIVANRRTGIDVDKWDYFARDSYHLGIQNSSDHERFLKFTRVCEVNGKRLICARDKEAHNLYEMFHARHSIHRRACQHKVTNIIQEMIAEALVKADPYILIEGSNGMLYKMSEAIDDMEAFTKLTDHVFEKILYSSDPKLSEAQTILKNIVSRRLYKFVGQTTPETDLNVSKEELAKELADSKPDDIEVDLTPEDFIITVFGIDYGKKEKNPIDDVYFYSKKDPNKAFQILKEEVSKLLPQTFSEKHIRVYCRQAEKLEVAKKYFKQWCDKNTSKPQ
ncbi:deoxynucleoside triphosphate triphosphohydrolase SAMHD1, partial [Clarias magur]